MLKIAKTTFFQTERHGHNFLNLYIDSLILGFIEPEKSQECIVIWENGQPTDDTMSEPDVTKAITEDIADVTIDRNDVVAILSNTPKIKIFYSKYPVTKRILVNWSKDEDYMEFYPDTESITLPGRVGIMIEGIGQKFQGTNYQEYLILSRQELLEDDSEPYELEIIIAVIDPVEPKIVYQKSE